MLHKLSMKVIMLMIIIVVVFIVVLVSAYLETGGAIYFIGQIIDEKFGNEQGALKWYTQAAYLENISAQAEIGYMYYYGRGVQQDYNEAIKWFKKIADTAYYYHYDYKNYFNNWESIQKYHNEDSYLAIWTLGRMYLRGEGVHKDFDEAIKWLKLKNEIAYRTKKPVDSIYNSSYNLSDDEAVIWLNKCVNVGDEEAYFALGARYFSGRGVEQDYRKSFEWYNKAAAKTYDLYKKGCGGFSISEDELKVMSELRCKQLAEFIRRERDAEAGIANSQYWLGLQYYLGQIISRDYEDAIKWFTKAAMQEPFYNDGSISDARFYLGQMYENGEGVIEDNVEAYKWYILAGMIPSNDTDALKAKKSLQDKMTQEQIAESQRRAKAIVDQKKAQKETEKKPNSKSTLDDRIVGWTLIVMILFALFGVWKVFLKVKVGRPNNK